MISTNIVGGLLGNCKSGAIKNGARPLKLNNCVSVKVGAKIVAVVKVVCGH